MIYVQRLRFLIDTLLACPMKSTMTVTIMLELRTIDEQTGTVSVPFRDYLS